MPDSETSMPHCNTHPDAGWVMKFTKYGTLWQCRVCLVQLKYTEYAEYADKVISVIEDEDELCIACDCGDERDPAGQLQSIGLIVLSAFAFFMVIGIILTIVM
jgi:hypothetical protein